MVLSRNMYGKALLMQNSPKEVFFFFLLSSFFFLLFSSLKNDFYWLDLPIFKGITMEKACGCLVLVHWKCALSVRLPNALYFWLFLEAFNFKT